MGRSRGGLTSKIHAVVDINGLPVRLALSPGEAHDVRLVGKLLSRLKSGSPLLTDRGYDADWIKQCRRVATRYDRLAGNYLAFVQLASIRLRLVARYECTP